MTEVNLPRGGSIVEKKDKRHREEGEEDGLFVKKSKKDVKKKGKPEDLPEGHENAGKENAFEGVWRSPINDEVLVDGVLGLGYVTEIRTSDVVLETASSYRVVLPISEVGAYGLSEMKADRLQIEDSFPIGHAVAFMVQKKLKPIKTKPLNRAAPFESNAVRVTADPAKINKHLGPTTISVGLAVAAEVKSIEEKGLILDLGLKNTSAFLPNEILPNTFTPKVGLPVVVRIQSTANLRMLQVALAVEMDTLSEAAVSSLTLRSIMPGTIILATPLQSKPEGAYVSLGNGVTAWLPRRAMPPRIRANIESFLRPIRVVVLLCQQNSRLLCVSAHPDIVAVSRAEKRRNFEGVHLGDVIRCEVTRAKNGKVDMKIVKEDEEGEEDGRGALVTVTATKASLEGDEKRYKAGSQFDMRVLGMKIVERSIVVGNTKEIMKQPMVSYQDAKGGAKVSAVIKKLTTAGIHVMIFGRIRGFIPIRYLSDKPLPSVEKAFPIGDSIPCRVLTASDEHRNVLLTARKAQISDTGSLITDISETKAGQTCIGVVVHQFPRGGSLVSFYNDVRGMLPDVECKKKKNLQVGDAVSVRVVSVDEPLQRISLAIADGSMPVNVVLRAKTSSLVSATTLPATVESVTGSKKSETEGIILNVQGESLTISPSLISDAISSPFSAASLEEILLPKTMKGREMGVLPLGEQSGLKRATCKRFLAAWTARVGGLPTTMEEIKEGAVLPGVVSQRVVNIGYTVEIPGGSGAIARIHFKTINEGASGERALAIGQTVVMKVGSVEIEKKRIEATLEWSSPSDSFSSSLELLRSTIGEQEWIGEMRGLPKLGEKISGVVMQVLEDVCLIKVNEKKNSNGDEITAYARKGNFDAEKIKKDSIVSALCIDYTWPRGDVEVVIVEGEEKKEIKKKGGKKEKPSPSSSSPPRLLLARRDYLAVLVDGTRVVFVPARSHPNHIVNVEELPSVGSPLVMIGKEEEEGGVKMSEREGEEERREKAKKEMEGSGRNMPKKGVKTDEKDEIDGPIVQKFGIYKARVEGPVHVPSDAKKAASERAKCAVLMKMSGGASGRLHISEFPSRFLVEGSNPMEAFLAEYQHRTVHVLVMTMKHNEIDGRKIRLCDVTLNESKLENAKKSKKTVDVRNKFHIGDIVPVFCAAHGLKTQLIYEVNAKWRALVNQTSDKHTVNDDFGVMKEAKVLAINKQSSEMTVVLVENMKLKPGSVCNARVKSFTTAPLKTQLIVSSGELGLLTLTAICDDYEKAVKRMKDLRGSTELVEVRLLAHHEEGVTYKWVVVAKERSAKKNGVVDPLVKSRDDVKEGATLRGFVAYIKKEEIKIEIGPGILVDLVDDCEKKEELKVNDLVELKVVEIDEDGDVMVDVEKIVQTNQGNNGQTARKRSTSTASDGESPVKRKKKIEGDDGEKKKKPRVEKEKKDMADPGFDWSSSAFSMDTMAEIGGISAIKIDEKETKMEVDGEEEKKEEVKKNEKKKTKKGEMTAADAEIEKEKKLSAKERKMMEKGAELNSDGDFARALKGDPNDAQLWIRYMSHFIGKDELAKARATAEKALNTINYREDAELFALWCAYVNLEVSFGDVDSWTSVFNRACESADSFKMHKHMASTLAENEKFAEADAIYEKLVKKFRAQSDEVWHLYGEYLYGGDREEEARALMTRALECVPKTRHVALIARFAYLEYTQGDEEKARNMYENLLATYPKRTEVWSAYVDLTVKHADVEQARQVLERVTSLPVSAFKLRPFYKKWIQLETQQGDEKTLAEVKKKALQYLNSLKDVLDE